MEAKNVNASYRNIGTFDNVIVNVPGTNDKHRKTIYAHQIIIDGKTIMISDHFRHGDIIEGHFVTRNIFPAGGVSQKRFREEKGQKMIARVTVVEKTDHSRGDHKSLILDIHLNDALDLEKGELILAIGTTAGEFPIPYTGKFVTFKKRM